MSAQPALRGREPLNEWFGRSGFDQLPYNAQCHSYVARLVQYISDPSTVRVRTLERYGEAPTAAVIRKMRAAWLQKVADKIEGAYLYGSESEGSGANLQIIRAIEHVVEPAPLPIPEPIVLPVAARGFLLPTGNDVVQACADFCGLTYEQLTGDSRETIYVKARNLCSAVLRARGNSYPNIGRFTLRKDHTTTRHAVQTFFKRDIKSKRYLAAWEALAPCVAKACRTAAELDAVLAARK